MAPCFPTPWILCFPRKLFFIVGRFGNIGKLIGHSGLARELGTAVLLIDARNSGLGDTEILSEGASDGTESPLRDRHHHRHRHRLRIKCNWASASERHNDLTKLTRRTVENARHNVETSKAYTEWSKVKPPNFRSSFYGSKKTNHMTFFPQKLYKEATLRPYQSCRELIVFPAF